MTPPSVRLLRTQTDERLVTLARAGHERAFEAIVERYRRSLLRYGRRYLPEARAEDALQQALISAWTALQRGDEVRELRPWLHRIVHNTSLNALRASGYDYEQLHDTLQGTGGPAELAECSAVVRSTLAGLAALPERQRDALLRIAVEGRSQDEVAQELGLSHGAVRQLVHRARSSLRAAATALTPLPLASWLAAAGGERADVAARVGELVAGGGATLVKAGAVAVLAGSAVSGPALVQQHADRPRPVAARSATVSAAPAPARATATADDGAADRGTGDLAAAPVTADRVRTTGRRRSGSGSGPGRRSGRHGGSGQDRSGPGRRGGDDDEPSGPAPRGDGADDAGSGPGSDDGPGSGRDEHLGSGYDGGDHGGSGDDERTGSVRDDEPAETSSGSGSSEPAQPEVSGAEGGDTEHSGGSGGDSGSGGSDRHD